MELRRSLLVVVGLPLVLLLMAVGGGEAALSPNFYATSCPSVESIVLQTVQTKLNQTFTTVPGTLRLFFHDCFILGCDAGIMISSPNNDAEKDASPNLSLAGDGFDTIIKAKAAVEAQCPGIVSCADIMAIAARDVVNLAGGPSWTVELGRRDGLVSRASDAAASLPPATFDVSQLLWIFGKKNLSLTDMVALSGGGHTLGHCHCDQISSRLSPTVDPTLDPAYAQALSQACPASVSPLVAVQFDPFTPLVFDNRYFKNLVMGMGLITSDQVLYTDNRTQPLVVDYANNQQHFFDAFVAAMLQMGRAGVLTGTDGEIRRDCTAFNS